jgi:molybdopterin converting factor small subunit
MLRLKQANGGSVDEREVILNALAPTPAAEWDRLQHFLDIGPQDVEAMLVTVEPLFRRGPELVEGNYDYLLQHEETAAILGWESGADPEHLAERRRFFTVWLARTLGMDLSTDFAGYLFRAGQKHAAHGPRAVHVPALYVTGAISLVNATFARFLQEELPGHPLVPAALAGWNKILTLHLHMMLMGYQVAQAWDEGDYAIEVALFGKMRRLTGAHERTMRLAHGGQLGDLLRKFFNYYPQARSHVFDLRWHEADRVDETGRPWLVVSPSYRVKPGWRVLVNGRDAAYARGLETSLAAGDTVSIFPPGR